MTSQIENQIQKLMNGKAIDSTYVCDYTLKDQFQELKATKGIESSLMHFTPICKQSVAYIVAAIVFNQKDELLMVQEAKSECTGTWYLPAGRVEPGEDLISAIKREVLEETGLIFEPITLISVESAKGTWFRFTFTGEKVGGFLKTVSKADKESLQASWIGNINQLNLRSRDILPLIDKTKNYYKEKHKWHKPIIPAIYEHEKLTLRLIMVIRKKQNNRLQVLVSKKNEIHLPVCEINPNRSVHASLKRFVQSIFGDHMPSHKPHGIVLVEHSGLPVQQKDGLCLTLLVSCGGPAEDSLPKTSYNWTEVAEETENIILEKLGRNKSLYYQVL